MPNFAVLDGEDVINTIIAESKTIAEEVTEKICIEFEKDVETGCKYVDGVFIPKLNEEVEDL